MTTVPTPHPLVGGAEPGARTLVRVGEHFVGAGTFTLVAGPVRGRDARAARRGVRGRGRGRRHDAAGRPLQAPDVAVLVPGSRAGRARDGGRAAGAASGCRGWPRSSTSTQLELVADVVDVVRVGARNMQNFELLRACAQTGKPVMIKRGLSATVEEWLLAAEYVAHSGNLDIILCERGIRTFEPSTRNTLDLSAVVGRAGAIAPAR